VKLISGYQAWDRFAYKQACDDIGKASRTLGLAWESRQGYQHLTAQLRDQENVLNSISRSLRNEAPSLDLLKDLLANARRRAVMEQRHDDSVARLYRFFEGLAQSVLWERHELRTAAIPAERLPKNEEWERVRQRAKDTLAKLGLEDSYRLLLDLNDPLGKAFPRIARGGDIHKMLQERNSSLMAHGVQAVGTKVFNGMFQACLDLAGWSESDLTAFIRLPED
ncbi:MAG: TIGR02710 family CRISPR-associated CARF protein, partial [Vicinamibacteria bacterium]|nr:TIGR02710 family CRISPR-associated CARF protein [Vicinamibacteria bacterium]